MNAGSNAGQSSPSPPGPPDRRRLSRSVLWEYAVATLSAGGPPFQVRVTDASDEGVGFLSPRALKVGQELTLSVMSLDVTGSLIRCRVVRCAPTDAGFSIGAAIVQ